MPHLSPITPTAAEQRLMLPTAAAYRGEGSSSRGGRGRSGQVSTGCTRFTPHATRQ